MSKNLSALSFRKGLGNNVFDRMVSAAAATGTAETPEAVRGLAEHHLVGDAISLGAVSFYDFLKAGNAGKKVFVCNGSACLVANTQEKLHDNLAKSFTDEEIGHICCLGRCHQGGAFQFEGKNYSGQSEASLKSLFESGEGDCVDRYAVGSTLNPPFSDSVSPLRKCRSR